MSDTIEREITINAPLERVWELVTQPEHVGSWFGDAGAEIDLRPGGAIKVIWKDAGEIDGRVDRVEPPTLFSWRWDQGKAGSTLVEFTLAPAGEGTLLRVVESGFNSLAATAEERRAKFDSHTEGWGIELGHLADRARVQV